MLKDIADNLDLALQRLNEISAQINNLLAEIRKLPDIFARITYANDLEALNVQIKSALVRYDQLINAGHPNNFIIEQTKDIYNRLVAARTALEASSADCPEEFVALAAVMSPLSYLLEMALLYRIGMDAAGLRDATTASYSAWFKALLDPARPNSLASAVRDGQAALLASGQRCPHWSFRTSRRFAWHLTSGLLRRTSDRLGYLEWTIPPARANVG
jgi:hypothetical protein